MDDVDFKNIYNKYYQDLFRFCFSFVHVKEDSEDIVQDVFLSLYLKQPKNENIKAWLFTVTSNKAKNFLRRNKVKSNCYQDYLFINSKDENSKLYLNVLNEVANLPNKYKEIINYYYFSNMDIKEISEALVISVSNVKKRLERARLILKERMKNE